MFSATPPSTPSGSPLVRTPSNAAADLSQEERRTIAENCAVFHSYTLNADGRPKTQMLFPRNNINIKYTPSQTTLQYLSETRLVGQYKSFGRVTSAEALGRVKSPLLSGSAALSCHTHKVEHEYTQEARCIIKYHVLAGTFEISSVSDVCRCDGQCTCNALFDVNPNFIRDVRALVNQHGDNLAYYHLKPIFDTYGDVFASNVTVGLAAYYEASISRHAKEKFSSFDAVCQVLCTASELAEASKNARYSHKSGSGISREVRLGKFEVVGDVDMAPNEPLENLLRFKNEKPRWRAIDLSSFLVITELLPEHLAARCRKIADYIRLSDEVAIPLYNTISSLAGLVVEERTLSDTLKRLLKSAREFPNQLRHMLYFNALDMLERVLQRPGLSTKCLKRCLELAECLVSACTPFDVNPAEVEKFLDLLACFTGFPDRNVRVLYMTLLTNTKIFAKFHHVSVYRDIAAARVLSEVFHEKIPFVDLVLHKERSDYWYYAVLLLVLMCHYTPIREEIQNGLINFILLNITNIDKFGTILVSMCSDDSSMAISWRLEEGQIQALIGLLKNDPKSKDILYIMKWLAKTAHADALVRNGLVSVLCLALYDQDALVRSNCLKTLAWLLPAAKNKQSYLEQYSAIVSLLIDGSITRHCTLDDVSIMMLILDALHVPDDYFNRIVSSPICINVLNEMLDLTKKDGEKKYCVAACNLIRRFICDDRTRSLMRQTKMIASLIAICTHRDEEIREAGHETLQVVVTNVGTKIFSPSSRGLMQAVASSSDLLNMYLNGNDFMRSSMIEILASYSATRFSSYPNFNASDFLQGILSKPNHEYFHNEVISIINTVVGLSCCGDVDISVAAFIGRVLICGDATTKHTAAAATLSMVRKTNVRVQNFKPIINAIGEMITMNEYDDAVIGSSLLVTFIQYDRYHEMIHGIFPQMLQCTSNAHPEDVLVNITKSLKVIAPCVVDGFSQLASHGQTSLLLDLINQLQEDNMKVDAIQNLAKSMTLSLTGEHAQACIDNLEDAFCGSTCSHDIQEAWKQCLNVLLSNAHSLPAVILIDLLETVDTYFVSKTLGGVIEKDQLTHAQQCCDDINDAELREKAAMVSTKIRDIIVMFGECSIS